MAMFGRSWRQCFGASRRFILECYSSSSSLGTKLLHQPDYRTLSTTTKPRNPLLSGHRGPPVSWYSTKGHRGIHKEKPKDLYAVLGVSPAATQQQVKQAYYKLSMKYHPDRNKGTPDAHQKFTELTEAYSILGQYDLRKRYDKRILHHHPGRQTTTSHPTTPSWTEGKTSFVDKDKVKFDFDEFYRAHYGDALKRQRQDKKESEEAKVRATHYSVSEPIHQLIIIVVILTMLGVVGSPLSKTLQQNKNKV